MPRYEAHRGDVGGEERARRVALYSERARRRQDLWTGQPLSEATLREIRSECSPMGRPTNWMLELRRRQEGLR